MNPRARKLKPELLLSGSNGLRVWLVQHDHQELWLEYHYRMNCMTCAADNPYGGVRFDVRKVPGFTEYPHKLPMTGWPETATHSLPGRQRHYAEIIARAIDTGWMPEATP